jgi:hypothetical protein
VSFGRIRRGIDALKEVDVLMLTSSREMLNHLRSIDSQIGGVAAQIVRGGDVEATAGISEGFKTNAIGSVLKAIVPIFGGALASLFGSKTEIVASGLYGRGQTVGDIVANGYDAGTFADTKKTSKFLGITTGTKYGTQYGAADASLENQFTLILRGFASAIGDAAGPLGEATDTVKARLDSFVVDIGKVDLKGLTGEQITERLSAIFGAAADGMAEAAFPGISRFQRAGEGMFETLVRISSTVEAVTSSFEKMGRGGIGIDASVALADLFDSVSDLTSAQKSYFDAYYTAAEQAAARTAQMERAIGSLGLTMPKTLAGFRQLVEAQDLTTDAGRSVYATLIQLAPAFADLQSAMGGAKSAADIMAERQDLERKLLELNGDTAAIRALDLAKLDASNRGLQEQVWAAEAAKDAADKAEELRKAWVSVGDSLADEIKRIRGLSDAQNPAGFAGLMGQFNAATAAARGGDMDAAKQLPTLSRSLLDAAANTATSRQELERVRAQTAAALEETYAAIQRGGAGDGVTSTAERTADAMAQAASSTAATASTTSDMATQLRLLTEQVTAMRSENLAGHAATAGNTSRTAKVLENVTAATGGGALQVEAA